MTNDSSLLWPIHLPLLIFQLQLLCTVVHCISVYILSILSIFLCAYCIMISKWIWLVKKLCLWHSRYPFPVFHTLHLACNLLPYSASTDNKKHLTICHIVPLLHFMYSWIVWHWPTANFVRACCVLGWTHRHDTSLKLFSSPTAGNGMSIPPKNKHVAEAWATHCHNKGMSFVTKGNLKNTSTQFI